MKKIITIDCLLILALMLTAGCSKKYNHSAKLERHLLEKTTLQKTGYDIQWTGDKIPTEKEIDYGITRDEAVRMALITEPSLHAQLEELGISKADLIQAGFLSNPRIDTIFRFPRKTNLKGNIELGIAMTISDLWQIPMRKKVAADQLAITSTRLLQTILTVVEQTKQAYNRALFAEKQLQTITKITDAIKEIRERVYQRRCAGLNSDFDIHFAEIALGEWETKIILQQMELDNAYIHLRRTIGAEISAQPFKTIETITTNHAPLLNPNNLIEYAKENTPETHINRLKIEQAKHQRSLEKRKIFNNVDFGISFERDADGTKLTGPSIGFEMPFFDWNQVQIAKTGYEEKMARFELATSLVQIEEIVQQLYTSINAQIKTIHIYETTIMPHNREALEYAATYSRDMQIDFITLFNTEIELYQKELELNQQYLDLWQNIASLERELGGSIPRFTQE